MIRCTVFQLGSVTQVKSWPLRMQVRAISLGGLCTVTNQRRRGYSRGVRNVTFSSYFAENRKLALRWISPVMLEEKVTGVEFLGVAGSKSTLGLNSYGACEI